LLGPFCFDGWFRMSQRQTSQCQNSLGFHHPADLISKGWGRRICWNIFHVPCEKKHSGQPWCTNLAQNRKNARYQIETWPGELIFVHPLWGPTVLQRSWTVFHIKGGIRSLENPEKTVDVQHQKHIKTRTHVQTNNDWNFLQMMTGFLISSPQSNQKLRNSSARPKEGDFPLRTPWPSKNKNPPRQLRTAPATRKGWALGVLGFTQDGLGCPHRCSRWDTVQRRLFFFGDIYNKNSRWGITIGGGFRDFLFSSRKVGKIPILTHIFQMGRNHQLDNYSISNNKQ